MAEIKIPVTISGMEVVKNTLRTFNDNYEFNKDTPDEYKKGFTDCLNCIVKAFEVSDDLKKYEK